MGPNPTTRLSPGVVVSSRHRLALAPAPLVRGLAHHHRAHGQCRPGVSTATPKANWAV